MNSSFRCLFRKVSSKVQDIQQVENLKEMGTQGIKVCYEHIVNSKSLKDLEMDYD